MQAIVSPWGARVETEPDVKREECRGAALAPVAHPAGEIAHSLACLMYGKKLHLYRDYQQWGTIRPSKCKCVIATWSHFAQRHRSLQEAPGGLRSMEAVVFTCTNTAAIASF